MKYDFDVILDRSLERSKTWDPNFLKEGQLPMHGAETHFICPQPVREAVKKVSEQPVYGYPYFTSAFSDAAAGWLYRRHGWKVKSEWVEFVGGIIPGIAFAIQAMTDIGYSVLINTPAYDPFRGVITDNDRVLVESKLIINSENQAVEFDWDDMESKFSDERVKAFILCDPHNPTGKSCTLEELKKIEYLSKKYNVFVITDEVHADFIYDGRKHICYPSIGEFAANFSAVTINPSKTFGVAGFRTGAIIIPNEEIRKKVNVKISAVKGISRTITGVAAFESCYGGDCDDYADQVCRYLEKNRDAMCDFFEEHIPELRIIKPQSAYVCWVDCRSLGFESQNEMMDFFKNEAGIIFGDGLGFDRHIGKGFIRIAFGFPKMQMMEFFNKLELAVKDLQNKM